jgi:MSHA biogenesis protein MshP
MFRNAGFAAVAAIFILVVLAGLGVVLVTISTTQQRSAAFDIQGVQAFQAARAGIEFGAYRTLTAGTAGGLVAAGDCTPAIGLTKSKTTTFALNGWTVNVQCDGTAHAEAVIAPSINVYEITATACNRAACPGIADATYVERELRVTVGSN